MLWKKADYTEILNEIVISKLMISATCHYFEITRPKTNYTKCRYQFKNCMKSKGKYEIDRHIIRLKVKALLVL